MKNLLAIRSYGTTPTRHSHDYNQVVLPLNGVINITVENYSGKVSPRECIVVRAHAEHLFTAEQQTRFIVADMDHLPANIAETQHIAFEINKPLLNFIMFVESQLESGIDGALEDAMYNTFYLLLESQCLLPKRDSRISDVLLFVEQHINTALTIDTLAGIAFMSATQFKKNLNSKWG